MVFGFDLQRPKWQNCIVAEGPFDALSVNGIALMHNTISKEQAQVLTLLNRRVIVVPDFDHAGLSITDTALDYGFSVSIPPFEGVKDLNEAALKYGKLNVIMSVVQHATSNKAKINFIKMKRFK
jgi:DNA primase